MAKPAMQVKAAEVANVISLSLSLSPRLLCSRRGRRKRERERPAYRSLSNGNSSQGAFRCSERLKQVRGPWERVEVRWNSIRWGSSKLLGYQQQWQQQQQQQAAASTQGRKRVCGSCAWESSSARLVVGLERRGSNTGDKYTFTVIVSPDRALGQPGPYTRGQVLVDLIPRNKYYPTNKCELVSCVTTERKAT